MKLELIHEFPGAIRSQDDIGFVGVYNINKEAIYGNKDDSIASTLAFMLRGVCHVGEDISRIAVNGSSRYTGFDSKGYTPYTCSERRLNHLGKVWSGVGATRNLRFAEVLSGKVQKYPVTRIGSLAVAAKESFARRLARSIKREEQSSILEFIKKNEFPSFLLLTPSNLVVARGVDGNEPVAIGEKNGVFLVASEDAAISNMDFKITHYLAPGEILSVSEDGMKEIFLACPKLSIDLTQYIHNLRGDSTIDGVSIRDALWSVGQVAADYFRLDGDVVMPILQSGNIFGQAFANARNIGFRPYLARNRYQSTNGVGFDFQKTIKKTSHFISFTAPAEIVEGRKIIITDNGINTGESIVESCMVLAKAGAKSVDYVVATPPTQRLFRDGRSFPAAERYLIKDSEDLLEELDERLEQMGSKMSVYIHCLPLTLTFEGLWRAGVNISFINTSRYTAI